MRASGNNSKDNADTMITLYNARSRREFAVSHQITGLH